MKRTSSYEEALKRKNSGLNGRIHPVVTRDVTLPMPAGLTAPAHLDAAAIEAAMQCGWTVYYAATDDGACLYDVEPYSHMPASMREPPTEDIESRAMPGKLIRARLIGGDWYVIPTN